MAFETLKMNTDNANKYLNERQIYQRDVWDSKGIEHPLDCLLEDYHQEQLKLLGKCGVEQSERLVCPNCKSNNTESDNSDIPNWCKDCGAEWEN